MTFALGIFLCALALVGLALAAWDGLVSLINQAMAGIGWWPE